ncbi:MAG: hypothetical protein H0T73_23035 [Ardenticatenales bacterium]|nr:hypothetical protein [Ardenticatenales bacterium]
MVISLDGAWQLGAVAQQPLCFCGDDRRTVAEWLPAQVPGNVHADLMRAGRLPDLYQGENVKSAGWVDDLDWWLDREVEVALQPGERAFLHFDGIDYLSTIWLDDRCLAHHEGAFSRLSVEITEYLPADGILRGYRIAVRLWGAAVWPRPAWHWWERLLIPPTRWLLPGKESLRPYHPRLRLLRPSMQAGWDFAPALPAIGLWEGARVELIGPVTIQEVDIGPWVVGAIARAPLHLWLDARREHSTIKGRVVWSPHTFEGSDGALSWEGSLTAGQNEVVFSLEIPSPMLWQPWEWGQPHLYSLIVTVETDEGLLTSFSLRFGIRTVAVDRMRLTINGSPFFARGVNWVPADILPGTVPPERYEQLLQMACERGVNFIRVWGGGGRERREFYELCDRLGILLWQEFPFACAFLDHYPRDRDFLDVAYQESVSMVRRLRHHPSLILWGAGNEYSYRRNRHLVEMLAQVVQHDDNRPFLPPSPGPDDRHNWHIWHGGAPLHELAEETTPFLSEFGLQALPGRRSLSEFLSEDSLWPPGDQWISRYANLDKLRCYLPAAAQHNLYQFIAASQEAQAAAVQIAVERLRRRKAESAGGVAIWQWNEPWPAISWALVDYFGRPKLAAERLRMWYSPLLLSLDFDRRDWQAGQPLRASLWAINDLTIAFAGCEARICQGEQCLWATPLALPAHSALRVADLALTAVEPAPLRLELWQNERCLAYNQYSLIVPGPVRGSLAGKLYRTLAEWVMRYL